MKKNFFLFSLIVLSIVVAGCATTEGERRGALAGGAIGAATGAIIGHQSGETGEGALIGGAIGALGGSIVGRKMEEQRKNNPNHLRISEIAAMAQKGVPDSAIIDEIDRTKSVYYLNSETIDYLKKNNVSNRVIDYMIATAQNK